VTLSALRNPETGVQHRDDFAFDDVYQIQTGTPGEGCSGCRWHNGAKQLHFYQYGLSMAVYLESVAAVWKIDLYPASPRHALYLGSDHRAEPALAAQVPNWPIGVGLALAQLLEASTHAPADEAR
jgi:hypothetical protein